MRECPCRAEQPLRQLIEQSPRISRATRQLRFIIGFDAFLQAPYFCFFKDFGEEGCLTDAAKAKAYLLSLRATNFSSFAISVASLRIASAVFSVAIASSFKR